MFRIMLCHSFFFIFMQCNETTSSNAMAPFSKIRHTYTVHCLQGETLHRPHRVFIDLYKFDQSSEIRQLLYTAISRAETIAQIHCIKGSGALYLHSEPATTMPSHEVKYVGRTGRIYKIYSPAEPKLVYIGLHNDCTSFFRCYLKR